MDEVFGVWYFGRVQINQAKQSFLVPLCVFIVDCFTRSVFIVQISVLAELGR